VNILLATFGRGWKEKLPAILKRPVPINLSLHFIMRRIALLPVPKIQIPRSELPRTWTMETLNASEPHIPFTLTIYD
jgi:hypothetical protein